MSIPPLAGHLGLSDAPLYPILASFRHLLVQSQKGSPYGQYQGVEWRDGFDGVKELWGAAGGQLLRVFYEHLVVRPTG